MRYLKTYQIFESSQAAKSLSNKQEEFLNKYTKGTWTYDPATGLVDVKGDFNCSTQNLKDFQGVKFGKVGRDFYCYGNNLTSLAGAPQKVDGDFDCGSNNLTSLAGAPQKVDGDFDCESNNLTSLAGAPKKVDGDFYCYGNKLTSLAGAPQKVDGNFDCGSNNLTSLAGAPQKIGGWFSGPFRLEKGEWNMEGWLNLLKEGRPAEQDLILTLISPEDLIKRIAKDPAGMIMKLKKIWNDENFKETRGKLVWPKGYEEEAGLVGDLDDVGF